MKVRKLPTNQTRTDKRGKQNVISDPVVPQSHPFLSEVGLDGGGACL